MVPVPPNLSSDGSRFGANPVGRRLAAYSATGDTAVLLEPAAEQEVVALLDAAVRTVIREQSIDLQPRLGVLAVTGWLFWLRSVLDSHSNPMRHRDLSLALALLAPLRNAEPESVPELMAQSVPPPPRPGDPQIGHWIDFVGVLLLEAGPHDRTALFAAVAVLQLGIVMSETQRHRTLCLGNTVHALTLLHEHRADPEVLAAAIRFARWLVSETPDGTPEHAYELGRLSDTLREDYACGQDPKVLGEAIALARRSVAGLPTEHPARPDRVTNLAGLLRLRYDNLGDAETLREAVALSRALVAELPPDHPWLARSVNNLANHLEALSALDGEVRDVALLDEIIDLGRAALSATTGPDSDPAMRTTLLANVSRWLRRRAEVTQRVRSATDAASDLADALDLARQAHAGTRGSRPSGLALDALLGTLSAHYARTRDPAMLAEAIALAREGVTDAVNAADLASRRFALGAMLNNRYLDIGEATDAREAAAVLREVATSPAATIPRRLDSAWHAGKLAINLEDWQNAAEDLALAVGLLPDVAGWHLQASDRERSLAEYSPLPTMAASCALATGDPERALELLEQGRGVLHAETAAVHRNLDRLRVQAPSLATALERLPSRLRSAPDADHRHRLAEERRQLFEEIRGVPGFQDFLDPPRITEILTACRSGPVAVPIFGRYRSDALIVTREGVRRLPLPQLTIDALRRLGRDVFGGAELALDRDESPAQRSLGEYSLRSGLALLWDAVAGPVLDALRDHLPSASAHDPTSADLPRMWWCPTGPLVHFPLHMAGRHEEASAFDVVVSSYTPTVHALGRTPPWRPGPDSRPLVVALPHTPGTSDLPVADQEAGLLTGQFPGARLLRGPAATRERLAAALPEHDIVHLACHAGYDANRHHEGHLVLHDGRLHFSDIAAARTGRAGLAFLSACGTARSRVDLPDESLNLLTAFQLAGFSQLVGSLWPIADQVGTRMVEAFYQRLAAHEDATVAQSLHHAVSRLRTRYPDRPSLWAPHVHVGS